MAQGLREEIQRNQMHYVDGALQHLLPGVLTAN